MTKRIVNLLLFGMLLLAACNGQTAESKQESVSDTAEEVIEVEEEVLPAAPTEEAESTERVISEEEIAEAYGTYSSELLSEEGEILGAASLERSEGKIEVTLDGCCLIPGNAYTVWFLFGSMEVDSHDVIHTLALAFTAEMEAMNIIVERNLSYPAEGFRILIRDNGVKSNDPAQLVSPTGGCTGMCPTVLTATFPSPLAE